MTGQRGGKVWQLPHENSCIHSAFPYETILFDLIYIGELTRRRKAKLTITG